MPICKPACAAIALFIAVFHWNSWFDAMVFNRFTQELNTLQFKLETLLYRVPVFYAVPPNTPPVTPVTRHTLTVVSMLPVLIVYPFLQKYFMAGVDIRGIGVKK